MPESQFKMEALPELSETVYLETINDIMQARDKKQVQRFGELCMEGMGLCIEAKIWHPDNALKASVDELLQMLAHLHLDAQMSNEVCPHSPRRFGEPDV